MQEASPRPQACSLADPPPPPPPPLPPLPPNPSVSSRAPVSKKTSLFSIDSILTRDVAPAPELSNLGADKDKDKGKGKDKEEGIPWTAPDSASLSSTRVSSTDEVGSTTNPRQPPRCCTKPLWISSRWTKTRSTASGLELPGSSSPFEFRFKVIE